MAFMTFNGFAPIDMKDGDLVRFGQNDGAFPPSIWSWKTPDGHDLDMSGSGLTFDADGRALSGRIDLIQIDVNDDGGLGQPDIRITQVGANATVLDDSPVAFWAAALAGTTIINAQALSADGRSFIFGDDFAAGVKFGADDGTVTDSGGNDVITLGSAALTAVGDAAFSISGGTGGGGFFSRYRAGNDQLLAQASDEVQTLIGDAEGAGLNGTLIAGDDLIRMLNTNTESLAVGDAVFARGNGAGQRAVVLGGDDDIEGLGDSQAALIGDVSTVRNNAQVTGGADTITGGSADDAMAGDVGSITSADDALVIGGRDTLFGNGGRDVIAGDVAGAIDGSRITGGNDTIRGGDGNDRIFGELFSDDVLTGNGVGAAAVALSGGNDRLFGDAGNDQIFGQTGADFLNGGAGNDQLSGGDGRDRFIFQTEFGADQVRDFEDGLDRFDLRTLDLAFADLTLRAVDADRDGSRDDVSVTVADDGTIRVLNTERNDLSAADFLI